MIRAFCLVLYLVAAAMPAHTQQPAARITASGEGRAAAVPDMATLTLGVAARAPQAGEALDQVGRGAETLLSRLRGAGIDERDVQTGSLTLRPITGDRAGTDMGGVTGYAAETLFRVRVRDLGDLGGLVDGLVTGGANRLEGVSFGLADPSALLHRARRRAVADALEAARLYAGEAGLVAGAVLSVVEAGAAPGPMARRLSAAEAALPVAPGEIEVVHRVTVTVAASPARD